jgi:hypothetical protein
MNVNLSLVETLVLGSYAWSTMLTLFLLRFITNGYSHRLNAVLLKEASLEAARVAREEVQDLVNRGLTIRIERLEKTNGK